MNQGQFPICHSTSGAMRFAGAIVNPAQVSARRRQGTRILSRTSLRRWGHHLSMSVPLAFLFCTIMKSLLILSFGD